MSDILCLYYSRTGKTKQAMEEIALALDAEIVGIQDEINRSGTMGFFMSGLDAVRKNTHRLKRFETEKALHEYRLVILGTPVWAGRCSAVMRGFLKRRGLELPDTAYVLTRSSDQRCEDVFRQMDLYTAKPHVLDVSLRSKAVGYHFWLNQFVKSVQNYLENGK
ncbi:MAG: hypothetical protein IJC58_07840 [Oscillospiraceae bacterium]|nr:hypothetical protein [Oscillospiraceae bacterium]